MASSSPLPLLSLLLAAAAISLVSSNQTYIVFMNPARKPSVYSTNSHWYDSHLTSLSIDPAQHLLYSYSLHAFSARLLPRHLPLLRSSPSVLSVVPDPLYPLHTTRSPHFLHLPSAAPSPSPSPFPSRDVIVGVLDTGVWPEHPSFSDAGLGPVPSRWKGECEAGVDFSPSLCNRKLVGARSFGRGSRANSANSAAREFDSPRDLDGHGTHTASTAAGAPVANASLFGYAGGVARGMAPAARVAAYKVCWEGGCYGSDILAGIDSAIADGVDVLSLSLGGGNSPFFRDPIAVGAFAAAQSGVFVACSAGNAGPGASTLTNTAPWIATVGAGTLDRDFPAFAVLGNGQKFTGASLYSGRGTGRSLIPIVYGRGQQDANNSSKLCLPGTLDPKSVKGKIVFCDRGINARVEKGLVVRNAGGIGIILANNAAAGEELVADSHLLPAVAVGFKAGNRIRDYVVSSRKPMGMLRFGGTVLNVRPSPVVAAFSSRGPNTVVPEILKPDLIGPGVNILAGWSGSIGPTGMAKDGRRTQFNIMSGTSMSCPHISGLAALLKASHPNWSPAAIKSALMTTSYTVDNTGSPLIDAAAEGRPATPLAYGSGHVDPEKALSPGLVYDATVQDYISFLCSTGATSEQVQGISKTSNATCPHRSPSPGNLNYPSFSVVFARRRWRVKYSRVLTNVGVAGSSYSVNYAVPDGVSMSVKPKKLMFKRVGDKLKYTVSFWSKRGGLSSDMAFGWIEWRSDKYRVRSPISYSWRAF